jgi:hypothetical protein
MVAKVRYEWQAFGVHISKEYMIDTTALLALPSNGSRDSLPVCARTISYSYAFTYCLIFHQHTEAKDVITSKILQPK